MITRQSNGELAMSPIGVDTETGYALSPEMERLCTIDAFWENCEDGLKVGTSISALRRFAREENLRFSKGLDRERRMADIYRERDLQALFTRLIKYRTDEQGFFMDDDGTRYATRKRWEQTLMVSRDALDKGIERRFGKWESVPHRKDIRTQSGNHPVYEQEDIKIALSHILRARNIATNGVHLVPITEGERTRIEVRLTAMGIREIIPKAGAKAKYVERNLGPNANRKTAIDRYRGKKLATFEIGEAISVLREKIGDAVDRALSEIEELDAPEIQDKDGKWVEFERFVNENPHANITSLIRHLILIRRRIVRTTGPEGSSNIHFLYNENELEGLYKNRRNRKVDWEELYLAA